MAGNDFLNAKKPPFISEHLLCYISMGGTAGGIAGFSELTLSHYHRLKVEAFSNHQFLTLIRPKEVLL
jgi:hypothetical protein